MQTCTKCLTPQPDENFAWRVKDKKRHRICRSCTRTYSRGEDRYTQPGYKDKHYAAKRARRAEVKEALDELKKVPCADCGRSFHPCAMDFDHREGTKKRGNVADLCNLSLRTALEEAAKCDVVCAVCHRIRTHLRRARGRQESACLGSRR